MGIGGVVLLGTVFLTCANIFFRAVWTPIDGTFELVGFCGAVLTAFALGYAQMRKSHISIDILTMRYPYRVRKFTFGVNVLACGIFFMLCGFRMTIWASTIASEGEVTQTLGIIYHPFIYSVAVGCFVLALVLFIDFLDTVTGRKGT